MSPKYMFFSPVTELDVIDAIIIFMKFLTQKYKSYGKVSGLKVILNAKNKS